MKGPMRVCELRSIVILDNALSDAVWFSWFLVASPQWLICQQSKWLIAALNRCGVLLLLLAEKISNQLHDHVKIILFKK